VFYITSCSSKLVINNNRGDRFWFRSVFIKKNNQIKIIIFLKKNRNRTETGSNRPVSVRFFRAKTSLARFSGFGSVFSGLARFFSGFLSVSVRFGFFGFLL